MDTKDPIIIYTWKDTKLNQTDPKVIVKDMDSRQLNPDKYNPNENAKQIARLFSMSLPGNTLDLIYEHIAKSLAHVLDYNLDYIDNQHVENLIRIAINELSEGDKIT